MPNLTQPGLDPVGSTRHHPEASPIDPESPPDEPSRPRTRRDRAILPALVALAVGARLAVIGPGLVRLDDPDGYIALARSLADGSGYRLDGRPTAYRPPLYPLALAGILRAVGPGHLPLALTLLHTSLGAATVGLVVATARSWGLPRRGVVLAGLVAAADPVLVAQARSVMTETLAASLVALVLVALARPGRAGATFGGLAFGLAALCRPSLLPGAFACAGLILVGGGGTVRDRIGRSALLLGGAYALLLPWMARNLAVFGEPIATTTHGGYTLLLANNPVYYAEVLDGPPGAVWSGPNQHEWFAGVHRRAAPLSEPATDRAHRAEALAFIRSRPRDFLRATLARLGRFWGVMPAPFVYPGPVRWLTALATVPLWALVALGLLRRRAWAWPAGAAPAVVLALAALHAAYWTDLRMRAPVVPALGLIAGTALVGRGCEPRSGPAG